MNQLDKELKQEQQELKELSRELLPCPFCKSPVSFHMDDEGCHGCHNIECPNCGMFDFGYNVDGNNECDSLPELCALIIPVWNTRDGITYKWSVDRTRTLPVSNTAKYMKTPKPRSIFEDSLPTTTQELINQVSANAALDRASSQMTLGNVIDFLSRIKPDEKVLGVGVLDSYRGYYQDLAFEPSDATVPVALVLDRCRCAVGKTFEGYKGGDFLMTHDTPMWVAPYSETGPRLTGFFKLEGVWTPITSPEE